MHMAGNPGPGGLADISTEIEGSGPVNLAEDAHGFCCQFHHFGACLDVQVLERWAMEV